LVINNRAKQLTVMLNLIVIHFKTLLAHCSLYYCNVPTLFLENETRRHHQLCFIRSFVRRTMCSYGTHVSMDGLFDLWRPVLSLSISRCHFMFCINVFVDSTRNVHNSYINNKMAPAHTNIFKSQTVTHWTNNPRV